MKFLQDLKKTHGTLQDVTKIIDTDENDIENFYDDIKQEVWLANNQGFMSKKFSFSTVAGYEIKHLKNEVEAWGLYFETISAPLSEIILSEDNMTVVVNIFWTFEDL